MPNRLQYETSPYLRQHAENPVDWYPWGEEAFRRAREEDKPIFLSIGYSTCHWCHVMAHESFEDAEIAAFLNRHFISIKVDREERPDIDSVYMSACRAFTGGGGWPMSIFMGADQKPFYAGSYFPKDGQGGMPGMRQLLPAIHAMWTANRDALLTQADQLIELMAQPDAPQADGAGDLAAEAVERYRRSFDKEYGGFGRAPKFPTPHNLLFLLDYHRRYGDGDCLEMAEFTLERMIRGGLFDHVGGGFCRYSTDRYFLVPHFEKMLYDNALMILACCAAHDAAPDADRAALYLDVAERTAGYVLRELAAPEGGFYSAQDADSDGEEGKYYVFTPRELTGLLGEADGGAFNRRYGITAEGNFEGKSIPNLLEGDLFDHSLDGLLPRVYDYRRARCRLHLDDKILTAWNGLMIAALCALYRASGDGTYLRAARAADRFIEESLTQDGALFASYAAGRRGAPGFLDDYAAVIYARLALYGATLERDDLDRAQTLARRVIAEFEDMEGGGFFMTAASGEALLLRPKEIYDAAMPSGNSLMAWNLVRLARLTEAAEWEAAAARQLAFMAPIAASYPPGYAMFLTARLEDDDPSARVTVVPGEGFDRAALALAVPAEAAVIPLDGPTADYPLRNGETTYYVCRNRSCLPPVNDIKEVLKK